MKRIRQSLETHESSRIYTAIIISVFISLLLPRGVIAGETAALFYGIVLLSSILILEKLFSKERKVDWPSFLAGFLSLLIAWLLVRANIFPAKANTLVAGLAEAGCIVILIIVYVSLFFVFSKLFTQFVKSRE